MKNYELVNKWTATLNIDAAVKEMRALKEKYPWLKCEQSLHALEKFQNDLPKIITVIQHQEKQNAIHRMMNDTTALADKAIIEAMISKYDIKL
jgi:hypothetical protein